MVSTIFRTMFEKELEPELLNRVIPDVFTPAEVIFHFLPKLYQVGESHKDILEPFLTTF